MALAAGLPGVAYLILTRDGQKFESANWKELQIATETPEHKDLANAEKEWKNEVVINLELMQQAGFAKRPFAAIWVEDTEKKTVKTIALWFNKPRWVPDMREWYRKNGGLWQLRQTQKRRLQNARRNGGTRRKICRRRL